MEAGMAFVCSDYVTIGDSQVYFSAKDVKRIERMQGRVEVVSTVCPDYPNDGQCYKFNGELGCGPSLTALVHLQKVQPLLERLAAAGLVVQWRILVADLPEVADGQDEFYTRVAGCRQEYLQRCAESAFAIGSRAQQAKVETFSKFYGRHQVNYLYQQDLVAKLILLETTTNRKFSTAFTAFLVTRMELSEKFRGRRLSMDEHRLAAAHSMSMYVTHGTLLRRLYMGQNYIVVNHYTNNLPNFYRHELYPEGAEVANCPRFPLGIIENSLY
jgi:hypothetical protein